MRPNAGAALSSAALLMLMGTTAHAVKIYTPTEAIEVSQKTGRPILAVDGSST